LLGGWVAGKAGLRIAYSNQKIAKESGQAKIHLEIHLVILQSKLCLGFQW
jgi:hypothetical protein